MECNQQQYHDNAFTLRCWKQLKRLTVSTKIALAVVCPTPYIYCNENSMRFWFGISTPPTRAHSMRSGCLLIICNKEKESESCDNVWATEGHFGL